MSESATKQRQHEHTIVLRPRGPRALRVQENGLHTAYLAPARVGSMSYVRPVLRDAYGPPPRAAPVSHYEADVGHERGGDLLVRFGIDSVFGRVVARVLMCFLLLQPVYVAFGAELDGELAGESLQGAGSDGGEVTGDSQQLTGDEETSDDGPHPSPLPEGEGGNGDTADSQLPTADSVDEYPHPTSPLEGEGADNASDGDTANSELPTTNSEDDGQVTTGSDELAGDSLQDSGNDTTSDDETTNSELPTADSVESNPHPSPPLEGEGADDGTLPPTTYNLPPTSEEATTSDEMVEGEVVEEMVDEIVASETNAGNKYTFGEGDCTLVADGEFYCVAPTVERYATGDPRVYAEKDREGDREIYYFDGVEIHRITNNSYDDFAPVFDDTTLRIAWQASIHDRMQIMVHELETNTTRQVTNARENSSNPHLLGDALVWQQWVDTNWEVMMADVDTTEEFEIEQLTDNAVHDMFPQLYQGLITWQREKGASWEVIVYDLRTGVEHALQKSDDTKYENPRFVLMFDSTHENGDVETIGYDIETGEMMELGTRANPQPLEPITPKDEVPDAPVQTASSTLVKVKEGGEE